MNNPKSIMQICPFRCMPFPIIQKAIDEARLITQAPRPLIAFSALAALSLSQQSLFDVELPIGKRCPCSLMLLVVARSGERKSTVDGILTEEIRKFEKRMRSASAHVRQRWQSDLKIWRVKDSLLQKKYKEDASQGKDTSAAEAAIREHDELRPKIPKDYKLIYDDVTSSALYQGLSQKFASAALMSSEGGGILSGGAFKDYPKLNAIWSGEDITIDRVTSESFCLTRARLTVSIMVQPAALERFKEARGELSRGSGQLARFLVCNPRSTQGDRFLDGTTQSFSHTKTFSNRIADLIDQYVQLNRDGGTERRLLKFSPPAAALWLEIHNEIEWELAPRGRYENAGDHASKLAENVARVAALLHNFEGFPGDISVETLEGAWAICSWASDCFLDLFAPPPQLEVDCNKLQKFFSEHCENIRHVQKNHVRQYGPVRNMDRLNQALFELRNQGIVNLVVSGKTTLIDLYPNLRKY